MGQAGTAVIEQVEQGEGDFAGHVDAAEILVELDAVEGHDTAVEQHEVAQMQVAVAFAYASACAPPGEILGAPLPLGFGPVAQAREQRRLDRQQALEFVEVFQRIGADDVGSAECGRRDRGACLEGDEVAGQLRQVGAAQVALAADMVEPLRLVEAAHLHGGLAGQVDDVEIQVGREASIQAQLFMTEEAALIDRAVVEKGQRHRLLDLVGERAREQYPGDMGFDAVLDGGRQGGEDGSGWGAHGRRGVRGGWLQCRGYPGRQHFAEIANGVAQGQARPLMRQPTIAPRISRIQSGR